MPIGSFSTFRDVIRLVLMNSPRTVLDLGIGHGINGAGVRNWLDCGVKPYRTRLEGVEGFEQYRSPLWDCYDLVHVTTIQEFMASDRGRWDMILITDVIEHFDKVDGLDLIEQCKEHLAPGGHLIIVTPAVWIEQGDAYGNELERHRSLWTRQDFPGFGIVKDGGMDDMGYRMLVTEYIKR